MTVHINAHRLPDGRAVTFYDRIDQNRHFASTDSGPADDELPHLRYDPVLAEWVAIAAHRQVRTFLPATQDCPLCPSRNGRHTEIPAADYDVVVFDNKWPSLPSPGAAANVAQPQPWATLAAPGACEVVCFSPDHDTTFAQLPTWNVRMVLDAWIDRAAALRRRPDIREVFVFENRGEAIGVTLHHPHGQIYGYPVVTPRTTQMLQAAARFRSDTALPLAEAIIEREICDGVRLLAEGEHWVAFVPHGSRWPVEVHLRPRRHIPTIEELTSEERDEWTAMYPAILQAFDALYGIRLPYISALHQSPVGVEEFALFWQLYSIQRAPDRLKYLAGSESAKGFFVNDRVPEQVAGELRAVIGGSRGE